MPPNLGGFFMVRSYYPSECHADYFDFERIEALKPAIEACGISTLSQSPIDRKSGSAGMPRPISYAVFCLKKKTRNRHRVRHLVDDAGVLALAGPRSSGAHAPPLGVPDTRALMRPRVH